MCGGSTPQAPAPVDPAAEAAKTAADATASANAKIIADARRKRASSNLLATLGQGLDTLGGGAGGSGGGSVLTNAISAGVAGGARSASASLLSAAAGGGGYGGGGGQTSGATPRVAQAVT